METKLKDYLGGLTKFTKSSNLIFNDHSKKDWFSEIGKYVNDNLDISKIESLSFLKDMIKEQTFCQKIKSKIGIGRDITSSIGIHFMTSTLDDVALRNMFGEPLLHDEFGEGFYGEYDAETDEYGEPEIKESYASYFVTIGDLDMHIGYDHRGTSVEVLRSTTMSQLFEALKELINLYKLKNNL